MSAQICLIESGYADAYINPSSQGKFMRATGSCCLVQSNGSIVLFDTMGPWERDKLLSRLSTMKIHPDDVGYVVCSHSHPDHIGNLNLFTKAKKHYVGTSVYVDDVYDLNCFEPVGSYDYKTSRGIKVVVPTYKNVELDENLVITPTQGHTMECVSMIVDNCDKYGKVGLVGDLFEKEQDVHEEAIWLEAGSQNADLQRANRTYIYDMVDYILPGHGPLFKTKSRPQTL